MFVSLKSSSAERQIGSKVSPEWGWAWRLRVALSRRIAGVFGLRTTRTVPAESRFAFVIPGAVSAGDRGEVAEGETRC